MRWSVALAIVVVALPCADGLRASGAMRRPSDHAARRTAACVLRESTPSPDVVERLAAGVVYLLPCADGFPYGSYIYSNVPPVGALAYNVLPFVNAFQNLPFVGLILFIGLSAFSRNAGLSRFVRFNIQQALLLDIALLIPSFFGGIGKAFPYELQAIGSNTVFYFMVGVVVYSWFSVAQGKVPNQVPVLSEAAEIQIGPL